MGIKNLVLEKDYVEIVEKMKQRVTRFYMETTDFFPMKRDKY